MNARVGAAADGRVGHVPAPFVVVKGYHMGSKWFSTALNGVAGAAFFFEYEHCLRKLAPQPGGLTGPEATLRYLRSSCGCADRCLGCNSSVPDLARPDDSGAHNARNARLHAAGKEYERHCMATGVSFAALGANYMSHLGAIRQLEPRLSIVLHVRSNHVKHGLSFLRVSCPEQVNHAKVSAATVRMRVPADVLLALAVSTARAQAKVAEDARSAAGGRVAFTLVYEAMQLDLDGEIRKLLLAIGVPAAAAAVRVPTLIKAGGEDMREALANFDEVGRHFRPLPCLHSMLVARGPTVFEMHACREEIASSSHTQRPRWLRLNASDCNV